MQNVQLANPRNNNRRGTRKGDTAELPASEVRRRQAMYRRQREKRQMAILRRYLIVVMFGGTVAMLVAFAYVAGWRAGEAKASSAPFYNLTQALSEEGGTDVQVVPGTDVFPASVRWRNGDYVAYCTLRDGHTSWYRLEPRLFGLLGTEEVYEGDEWHPDLSGKLVAIDGEYEVSTACIRVILDLNSKLAHLA